MRREVWPDFRAIWADLGSVADEAAMLSGQGSEAIDLEGPYSACF